MNAQRLNDIFRNIHIAEKSDMESIRQLTVDYPYYYLPYVVLAKYYYDTGHYKFEDMLRQAAMRVRDRKKLYRYIHGREESAEVLAEAERLEPEIVMAEETGISNHEQPWTDPYLPDGPELHVAEDASGVMVSEPVHFKEPVQEDIQQKHTTGISEFLEGFDEGTEEKPEEFVFEGKHEERHFEDIPVERDVIGEEIETEFSFSKAFNISTEHDAQVEESEAPEPLTSEPAAIQKDDERKHPVSRLDEKEAPKPELEDELSPEKDFFAWLQHPQYVRQEKEEKQEEIAEHMDHKTELIERFISVNPQISRPKKEFYNPENMAKRSEVIDLEYVTETLANIYYEQGNIDLAIRAYEKLSLQNPSKQAYFASLIEKIKKGNK